MLDNKPVVLEFSKAEALVLFEFISNFNASKNSIFADVAEEMACWSLEYAFQKTLAEPFREDYLELVAEARRELQRQHDGEYEE